MGKAADSALRSFRSSSVKSPKLPLFNSTVPQRSSSTFRRELAKEHWVLGHFSNINRLLNTELPATVRVHSEMRASFRLLQHLYGGNLSHAQQDVRAGARLSNFFVPVRDNNNFLAWRAVLPTEMLGREEQAFVLETQERYAKEMEVFHAIASQDERRIDSALECIPHNPTMPRGYFLGKEERYSILVDTDYRASTFAEGFGDAYILQKVQEAEKKFQESQKRVASTAPRRSWFSLAGNLHTRAFSTNMTAGAEIQTPQSRLCEIERLVKEELVIVGDDGGDRQARLMAARDGIELLRLVAGNVTQGVHLKLQKDWPIPTISIFHEASHRGGVRREPVVGLDDALLNFSHQKMTRELRARAEKYELADQLYRAVSKKDTTLISNLMAQGANPMRPSFESVEVGEYVVGNLPTGPSAWDIAPKAMWPLLVKSHGPTEPGELESPHAEPFMKTRRPGIDTPFGLH